MNKIIDTKADKLLKEVTCLAIDSGFTMKSTTLTILDKEYYVTFNYRLMPNKCEKCGNPLKEA